MMVASFGPGIRPDEGRVPEEEAFALRADQRRKAPAAAVDADEALHDVAPPDVNWRSPEKARKAPLPVKRSDKD